MKKILCLLMLFQFSSLIGEVVLQESFEAGFGLFYFNEDIYIIEPVSSYQPLVYCSSKVVFSTEKSGITSIKIVKDVFSPFLVSLNEGKISIHDVMDFTVQYPQSVLMKYSETIVLNKALVIDGEEYVLEISFYDDFRNIKIYNNKKVFFESFSSYLLFVKTINNHLCIAYLNYGGSGMTSYLDIYEIR
ncbi:MAG: hypothetical protein JXR63_10545 [Spirochaetales bacterium]|nr:hypothetical protein [Spirochaetales bacterium]